MHYSYSSSDSARFRCFLAVLFTLIYASWTAADLNTVEGRVIDETGAPIQGAQVFLEQGLGGTLHATETRPDGSYRFENVLPGLTAVFASAKGYAFGGKSIQVAISGDVHDADIRLRPPGTISGTIKDHNGKPVTSARITRALLPEQKISIPLAKLVAFGIAEPRSDKKGRFSLSALPQNQLVVLKIAHPKFAQEATSPIEVGSGDVKLQLIPGVLIMGKVTARGSDTPVSNATLFFRNVIPEKGTVVTHSGGDGAFSLRLRPGAYAFWASGSSYRSPVMQPLTVTGEYAKQNVSLAVAARATLTGIVKDAQTGEPVQGARMILESYGVTADVTRTGPTGAFEFSAAEGESVVRLSALPGYMTPAEPAIRITVAANTSTSVPTFWVAPLPTYTLDVVDSQEAPVAGAIVSILRPAQFGWHITDSKGSLELKLASLPADGTVIGVVEHPLRKEAALFAITRERSKDAIVQLVPTSTITGRVVSQEERGLQGAIVESRFTYEGIDDTQVLWRTVTNSDGVFTWNGVIAHTPQLPVALAKDKEGVTIESSADSFIASRTESETLPDIRIENASGEKSMLGRRLKWFDLNPLCEDNSDKTIDENRPAVVMYCSPQQAPYFAESLEKVKRTLKHLEINFALVVSDDITCPEVSFPIFKGDSPGVATTYLLNREGRVTLETFGLPPVFAIRNLLSDTQ